MKMLREIAVVTAIVVSMPFVASAQSLDEIRNMSRADKKTYLESMSVEERTAMREKWRAEYENLSDEEKQTIRKERGTRRDARRAEMRARWASMSEDERAAAIEKRHDRKSRDGRRHKGRRDHDRIDGESDSSGDPEQ